MAVASFLVPLGTPMPPFTLTGVDGVQVSSADLDAPALLVAFLSNHCPYVRHIEQGLAAFAKEADPRLAIVAVSSNDVGIKSDDDVPGLRGQIARTGFPFPYLLDPTQQAALDFRAACTPDFFLYGSDRRLAYRGAFDRSRPRSGQPVTGDLLRAAVGHVLAGEAVPEPHTPSLGCGIKWSPGNAPS
jgi:thiol-disulfide isomerase/thioredoxin